MYTNYHRILLSNFGCQVWPVGYLQAQKAFFFLMKPRLSHMESMPWIYPKETSHYPLETLGYI